MARETLIHHFLAGSAERFPEKVALVCGNQRLTYQEIDTRAGRFAAGFQALGVKRHDRVAVFLENSAESVISIFGILKAGAIFIPLNPTLRARKLGYILKDSGARALVTQYKRSEVVSEAVRVAPELEHAVWVDGPHGSGRDGVIRIHHHSWQEVFGASSEGTSRAASPRNIDLDLASILYTSGSTGEPKGVMCAHASMVAAAMSITEYLESQPDDIVLNSLPLSFDYGLYQVLMTFLVGGTVVLEKSFVYPRMALAKVREEGVTGLPIVPTMAALLLQIQDLSKYDLSSLRYITNTAAALPLAHIRRLRALLPWVKIFSMYGLTECKRVSYLPPEFLDEKPASVGIPIPNEEVFIVGEEGKEVGPHEVGELVVRGANVMQGYWNDPGETARVFRQGSRPGERLLYTGDLFRRDEEGFLYFVARKDDLIKTRGERVSPREIEDTLCNMEGIREAAAMGVPDEILGQAIRVAVVPSDGKSLTEKEVLRYCKENLEAHMVPKYVEILDSLPVTATGKPNKRGMA
jgi:amino acid adenylation domain-containing protein